MSIVYNIEDQQLVNTLNNYGIPVRMHDGLIRYVNHYVCPGNFLQSIITNDLRASVLYADDENIHLITNYVRWFHNEVPGTCWGDKDALVGWVMKRQEEKNVG